MAATLKITDFMLEDLVILDIKSKLKEGVLKELSSIMAKSAEVIDEEKCFEALLAREQIGSTGIGKEVAIPHAKTDYVNKLTIGFGISREGIDFGSLDDKRAKIFFVFASPIRDSQIYLKILARISRLIRNEEFRTKLLEAKSSKEILNIIDNEEGSR